MNVNVALIGGGLVGQGFLSVLRKKAEHIQSRFGVSFQLTAVCDRTGGSAVAPDGLSVGEILPLLEDGRGLLDYQPASRTCVKGLDASACIELSRADVVVECTSSDLFTGEPATGHIRKALEMKKHVITSNKGPVALHYRELSELARAKGVQFRYEATVMGGTPVIRFLSEGFRGEGMVEIRGVLNATTNFILCSCERGKSFDEAVREARERGLMESNPDMDLDGYDSAAKLMILMNAVAGGGLRTTDILREGIRDLSQKDVQGVLDKGLRYRMVSHAWRGEDGSWKGHVGPFKLSDKDPLYRVCDARNAVSIRTETLGEIYLEGPGGGKMESGTAILSDLLAIYTT